MARQLPGCAGNGPERFGRKCAWLAVGSEDHTGVLRALGITGSTRCRWAEGMATAYREEQVVFLTPPRHGWTLVLAPLARWGAAFLAQPVAIRSRASGGLGVHRVRLGRARGDRRLGLDEATVRSMKLRPLWRILVEIGQG